MKNKARDPFQDFVKKWMARTEITVSFLAWIMHLLLMLCISGWLMYLHLTKIQENLNKNPPVISSQDR